MLNMRKLLVKIDRNLENVDTGTFALTCLLMVTVLGWLDYATGFEISFSFFYLLPILLAAWYIGLRYSILITTLSLLTWLFTNLIAGETFSNEYIRYFNFGVRLIVFFLVALLLRELKHALRYERRLARTDHLTGIFNRREFHEQLEYEIKRAARLNYPITFAYIDLDNFKQLNDKQGHAAGDEQLKLIALSISKTIRKTDLFARLGGDEFGLFLPNVDQTAARMVIAKVENAVTAQMQNLHSPITLSMGVVTFHMPPASSKELILKADALMYEAKQKGKGQVVYLQAG